MPTFINAQTAEKMRNEAGNQSKETTISGDNPKPAAFLERVVAGVARFGDQEKFNRKPREAPITLTPSSSKTQFVLRISS